jgi:hypothetical protein
MTGRQRVLGILNGAPPERAAWTTLVDDRTRSVMPADVREMHVLDFYRHIGCDLLQFGNYGLPPEDRVPLPARLVAPPVETETRTEADGTVVRTRRTPWGSLVAATRGGHPIQHAVGSVEELRILRELWAGSHYEEVEGTEAAHARLEATLGDLGLFLPTLGPSPVQQLLQLEMGVANFYYLLADHRAEVEALLDVMQTCRRQEYEIVARRTPAPGLIATENTSTSLISPTLYRRYSLPQIRDYAESAHRHGKKLVLHMCGLLRGILPELAETGLDGINALTPPPVGDLPFDEALDALGDDLVILGGVFDASVFQKGDATADEIGRALDALFTPRLRRTPFLLWLVADGLPTPVDRFLAVRDWVEQDG